MLVESNAIGVPEPGSIILAGLGFAGMAAWVWRRRKSVGTLA
jgi:hypothetical protein